MDTIVMKILYGRDKVIKKTIETAGLSRETELQMGGCGSIRTERRI